MSEKIILFELGLNCKCFIIIRDDVICVVIWHLPAPMIVAIAIKIGTSEILFNKPMMFSRLMMKLLQSVQQAA